MVSIGKTKVIAVIGNKKSGKTSLITLLTSKLTQKNLKIFSVKHVSKTNFTIDTPQTDTWKYIQSGAKMAVCVSKDELATIRKTKTEDYNLEELLRNIGDEDADLVLLEGFRYLIADRKDVPKIVTAKNMDELKKLFENITPPILVAVGKFNHQTDFKGVPLLDPMENRDKLLAIVEQYLKET